VRDEQLIVSPATFAGGVSAIDRAWDAGRRPTAVLAMSDAIAIGAIRGLRDRGLSIPTDVSVVGFDDIELAQTTDPPLTTVHQPIRGKGEEAARLLLSVIGGRESTIGHRRLATRLIVRASTASVPNPPGR
jgi:DNA-binding LacI/PurR family transcriptional regulator